MVAYRRARVPGGTYFFTVTLRDRQSGLLLEHAEALGAAFREVRRARMFDVHAIVVLPDHLHTVWRLPPGDSDFAGRWRAIKSGFTRRIKAAGEFIGANMKREHELWQRRYWEHLITDATDYARHVDYIHYNPVRHGYVSTPADWRWSSFQRHVRAGMLPADWGGHPDVQVRGDD